MVIHFRKINVITLRAKKISKNSERKYQTITKVARLRKKNTLICDKLNCFNPKVAREVRVTYQKEIKNIIF